MTVVDELIALKLNAERIRRATIELRNAEVERDTLEAILSRQHVRQTMGIAGVRRDSR